MVQGSDGEEGTRRTRIVSPSIIYADRSDHIRYRILIGSNVCIVETKIQ